MWEGVVRNRFAAGAGPVLGMKQRGWRIEVDPSLCVFREIWAAKGREFEIVASEVNLGKRFFMSGLAVDMRRWTEESAMDGWRLFREKLAKRPMKCIGTGQAGVFATRCEVERKIIGTL